MSTTTTSIKILGVLGAILTSSITLLLGADASNSPSSSEKVKVEDSKDSSSSSEDVLVLSPFEVAAEKGSGYVASESITGTRIATKLRESPMVVDVVTAEFMRDFGAFDMSQQIGWVANVSPTDSDGSFILRGFTSTPFVDGFRRLGPLDLVDTARIEIIKGPAASIYGQTLPGGVLNYTSKRPKTKPETQMGITVGTEGFFRSEFSSTGPVGSSKKLFYMTNMATSTRSFEQEWASQQRKNISVQFMYKLDANTTFNVKFAGQTNHSRDRQALPWVKSSSFGWLTNNNGQLGINADGTPLKYTYNTLKYTAATNSYSLTPTTANLPLSEVVVRYNTNKQDYDKYQAYIKDPSQWGTPLALTSALSTVSSSWDRLATEYPNMHTNGPTSYTDYSLWSINFGGERRWSDLVNSRFTVDIFNRPSEQQTFAGNQLVYNDPNYPDGKVGDSTPTWREQYSKGYSGQLDNLFSFKTGPINHKLLATFDFTHKADRDYRRTTNTSGSFASAAAGTAGYNLGKYYIKDGNDPTVIYPRFLPLGPRSTGVMRLNGTAYGSYDQLIAWPYDGSSYWVPTYADYPELYKTITNNTLGASDDYGLFVSERASVFNGRITALVGGRYDYLQNWYKNYASTDPVMIRSKWDEQALTTQMGLTGYLTKNIILFANKSTAYNPNMQVVNRRVTPIIGYDAEGEPITGPVTFETTVLPNEKGKGYEFGTRFTLLDQRLNISLSRFVIDRENKVDSFTNEFGVSEYVGSGAQRSKGYEVSFNWAVTDSLQFMGNYGYNDTRYTKNTLAYLIGSPTAQNAKNNYGISVLYAFKNSALKGLRLTAGARYYDKSLINVGSGGLASTNPYSSAFKPVIRNTPLATGALPFPDLPAELMVLSSNVPTARNDPTGAVNPSTGAVLAVSSSNANKGYVEGVNIPAGWVKYTGQAMDPNTNYYIIDGDGNTSASYKYKTNLDDHRSNVYNGAYALVNFGVSYSFRQTKKISHSVRFNMQNALDRFYTYGNGVLGYGREYTFSYTLSF